MQSRKTCERVLNDGSFDDLLTNMTLYSAAVFESTMAGRREVITSGLCFSVHLAYTGREAEDVVV